jgi:hypothetical protein
MPWIARGQRRYYYRGRRCQRSGSCRLEYVGTGARAELAAALDRHRREMREKVRMERTAWRDAGAELKRLIAASDLLLRACLLGAGFRQHDRGAWRRRRNEPHF